MKKTSTVVLLATTLLVCPATSARDLDHLAVEKILGATGVTDITHAYDHRLLVLRQSGLVQTLEKGSLGGAFLDLRSQPYFGIAPPFSLAVHPDFPVDPRVFVFHSGPDREILLSRFETDPEGLAVDPETRVELLRILPEEDDLHRGGMTRFGPDGHLYLSIGDAGDGDLRDVFCHAQNGSTFFGSVLRLDVDEASDAPPFYSIPPDNPFVDDPTVRDEIWAIGLRNPWRVTFDRLTGDLYIADVGHHHQEEWNMEPAGSPGGRNYGWNRMEGTRCHEVETCPFEVAACNDPTFTPPALAYEHIEPDHSDRPSGCAVMGGYVSRGIQIPELSGAYVFGDYCTGEVFAARPSGSNGWTTTLLPEIALPLLQTFGEDAFGELYLANVDSLYRLVARGEVAFQEPSLEIAEEASAIEVRLARNGPGERAISVQWSTLAGSALPGEDYEHATGVVHWEQGDLEEKVLSIPLRDDLVAEGRETLQVQLVAEPGVVATPRVGEIAILDSDGLCLEPGSKLCLHEGRFVVTANWSTPQNAGSGQALPLTRETGFFTFFSATNVELAVKVIDGCALNGKFWVFASGLTDTRVELRVVDTSTGEERLYTSPGGQPFEPLLDTTAFATCP